MIWINPLWLLKLLQWGRIIYWQKSYVKLNLGQSLGSDVYSSTYICLHSWKSYVLESAYQQGKKFPEDLFEKEKEVIVQLERNIKFFSPPPIVCVLGLNLILHLSDLLPLVKAFTGYFLLCSESCFVWLELVGQSSYKKVISDTIQILLKGNSCKTMCIEWFYYEEI